MTDRTTYKRGTPLNIIVKLYFFGFFLIVSSSLLAKETVQKTPLEIEQDIAQGFTQDKKHEARGHFHSNNSATAKVSFTTSMKLTGHPVLELLEVDPRVAPLLYPPIFKIDSQGAPICSICKTQPSFANKMIQVSRPNTSKSRISVEIEISDDLRWGDGVAVTGHDLAFSWEVGKNMSDSPALSIYSNIISVDVPRGKPKTAIFLIRGATYDHRILKNFRIIPRHLEQRTWLESKKILNTYRKKSAYTRQNLSPNLLFNHLRILKQTNTRIVLEVSPSGDEKRIVYSFKQMGDVDEPQYYTVSANMEIPPTQRITKTENTNGRENTYELAKNRFESFLEDLRKSNDLEILLVNHRNPLLSQNIVRKALWQIILKSDFFKTFGITNEQISKSILSKQNPFYFPSEKNGPQEEKTPKSLLTEAGWEIPSKGKYYESGSNIFEISITFDESNKQRKKRAIHLKKVFEDAGIKIKLKEESSVKFYERTIPRIDFKGLALVGIKETDDINLQWMFHSDQIPTSRNSYSGQNWSAWYSKEADKITEKLAYTLGRQKRMELYQDLQKLYAAEVPSIPLFFHKNNIKIQK